MAEDKQYPMTVEGKQKLEEELNDMITNKRGEITKRIQIARSFGDLSENSEYQSAKDEQAFVEGRIKTLQSMLQYSVIIDSDSIAADEVAIGKMVTFKELPDEEPETYTIVGAVEADPLSGKISNESPIAKALNGHKVDDQVSVPLPNGDAMDVEIIEVKTK